jgi:hypothetical protein
MSQVVEAINEVYNIEKIHGKKLFLAGGITNCPDWQSELIEKIKDFKKLIIYNPRRKNFPIEDPNASEQQITWEYEHLRDADIIVFWFSRGSLNPIVLFELGRYGLSNNSKKIIIGLDPEYQRKQDVIIQTKLSRPDVHIVESLDEVKDEITRLW